MLPGKAPRVEGQILLDALLCQNGGAGGHVAHHGHLPGGSPDGGAALYRDGAGLPLLLGDKARRLQPLQMKVDGGGGLEPHMASDLPHRGGIAVVLLKRDDVLIDLPLLFGERLHQDHFHSWDCNAIISYNLTKVKRMF